MAAIAVSSLALFAACGDDDDDNGSGDETSTNNDRDDEDNDDNDDSSGGGGKEEEYIRTICTAFGDFGDSLNSILTDPDNQNASEDEALELFEEPFADLLDAIDDADPPGDIDEFHEALVNTLEDSLEGIRDGDVEALQQISEVDIPTPSAEIEAKYSALADDIPECAEANVFN